MILSKHARTVTLSILVLSAMNFSILPAGNTAMAASWTSKDSATLVFLPADPRSTHDTSHAQFSVGEMAWLEPASFDSVVFLLPSNDKKDKKNKHADADEGNSDNDRKPSEHDQDGRPKASVSVQLVFGERDRQVIRDYCAQPSPNLPPGLAKRGGQLPPGLEKQLRRNGQLPPGLQKKVEPFPRELERRLPPLPRNYVRVFVAGRGMIVDAQFNIVDIIDIFR